jgi:hypothetical protein
MWNMWNCQRSFLAFAGLWHLWGAGLNLLGEQDKCGSNDANGSSLAPWRTKQKQFTNKELRSFVLQPFMQFGIQRVRVAQDITTVAFWHFNVQFKCTNPSIFIFFPLIFVVFRPMLENTVNIWEHIWRWWRWWRWPEDDMKSGRSAYRFIGRPKRTAVKSAASPKRRQVRVAVLRYATRCRFVVVSLSLCVVCCVLPMDIATKTNQDEKKLIPEARNFKELRGKR